MALIIMILMLAFVGNMVALGVAAILGSIVWTAFFMVATSANLYGLYTLRNASNARFNVSRETFEISPRGRAYRAWL